MHCKNIICGESCSKSCLKGERKAHETSFHLDLILFCLKKALGASHLGL